MSIKDREELRITREKLSWLEKEYEAAKLRSIENPTPCAIGLYVRSSRQSISLRGYNLLPTSPERQRRASLARRWRSGLVALFVSASKEEILRFESHAESPASGS
jgi:hypothetical protein